MHFVYPALLYGLSLIAIPIIIHLFNFRRYKTVYFTNVKFLKEIKEETAVQSRVKHLLVLLARILAVIFLVLAFAQPVIPVADAQTGKEGKRGVSIYIDNSFSMNAEADGEQLINRAKRKAKEILNAYGEEDRFQLVTNEFGTRQQRFVSKEEFLGMLDEVKPSSRGRSLKQLHTLQKEIFTEAEIDNKIAYWISDFQKNIVADFKDTSISISLIPLQPSKQQNVYIDSCWLERPVVYLDQPNELLVKIQNTGEQDIEASRMTLAINGQVKAISDFSVPSNSFAIDTINFSVKEAGWKQLKVAITDYPITFDDNYFVTFNVTDQVNVLAINDEAESKYLQALYSSAEKFAFSNQFVNQLDYSGLRNFSLIILNNLIEIPSGLAYELKQYIESGGAIVTFPNPKANIESYNKFFTTVGVNTIIGLENIQQSVTYLNREHEIFMDVFEEVPNNVSLPSTELHYKFSKKVQSNEEVLLGLRNKNTFVSEYDHASGKVFVCASPLEVNYTDYPVHALFVPMLYKMALSGGNTKSLAYVLGKDDVIKVDNKLDNVDEIYKIKGAHNEFIPQQKAIGAQVLLSLGDQVDESGIYTIYRENPNDGEFVALNYDRMESRLDYYTASELKEMYTCENINVIEAVQGSITEFVKELDEGIILWKLCIILALIFIGLEVLLLRFLP